MTADPHAAGPPADNAGGLDPDGDELLDQLLSNPAIRRRLLTLLEPARFRHDEMGDGVADAGRRPGVDAAAASRAESASTWGSPILGEALQEAPLSVGRGVPRRPDRKRSVIPRPQLPVVADAIVRTHPGHPVHRPLMLPPVQSEPGGYVRKPGEVRYLNVPRKRLIAARKQAGMTQYELAVATGITVTAVSNLEVGRTRYPRLVTFERIAAALGVPLKWLCEE